MIRTARPSSALSKPLFVVLALIAIGCGADDPQMRRGVASGDDVASGYGADDEVTGPLPESVPRRDGDLWPDRSPVADGIRPLPPAAGLPMVEPAGPVPVAVRIEALDVESAVVRAVGVEPNGEMEVPPPTEVGWYGFGPAPGQTGSAVLAAHIAADGVDGVFRYLTEVAAGDRVEIAFDDGSIEAFEIVELRQYGKRELPFDDLFARDGAPRLALITCGGDFNPSIRSYEDNVVAYALPV